MRSFFLNRVKENGSIFDHFADASENNYKTEFIVLNVNNISRNSP